MIKELHENDLGIMEGVFYSELLGYDMQVRYAKDIPVEYIEKNIQYFNHLEPEFVLRICEALKRYYEFYKGEYPDLCEECEEVQGDVLKAFEKDPETILEYVRIGTYKFDECNIADEDIPVLNLRGDCAWSGDKGVTIAAKNNQLVYVGTWQERNVWDDREESRLEKMFNYAVPKE